MIEGLEEVPAEQGHPAEHGHCKEVEGVAHGQAGVVPDRDEELLHVVDFVDIVVVFGNQNVVADNEEEGGHED